MARPEKTFALTYHIETVYLFTRSDFKTIFFPVIIFAVAASSTFEIHALIRTAVWTWIHLLQANVSNQTFSGQEDKLNKPWRPLPSGRITVQQARAFRFVLAAFCFSLSYMQGPAVAAASFGLTVVEILHDDFSLSRHPILKNLCNVGGYLTFEIGATLSMASSQKIDATTSTALLTSALVIFTTISAQDFADTDGDKLSHRRTLPLIAPIASRWYISIAVTFWSLILAETWGLGPFFGGSFLAFGTYVGSRYFRLRDATNDQFSYVFYNIWLLIIHLLPLNAHNKLLCTDST
ncbi:hypothetical protein CPC08DRAFT_635907 [Agrocybe pediades]|nr:hypothetical protein CPC08DRAFT_635907 [Agrocybe pediades]